MGASLLAKAVHQAIFLSADTPLSRAGSLLQGFGLNVDFVTGAEICGSWLASDGGVSVKFIQADTPLSRAGSLLQF
ncbi:hypothetical protein EMIT0232MI5_30259 [Pseudomonas sp. IT-232MI5]